VDNIPDDTYDFIGLYSVLHHIPDYLYVIENLTPKLKTGGVLYIAHETCASYWDNYEKIDEFKRNATRLSARIKKYLRPRNYINKLRRIFIDPHYAEEGDIHVFRDDHIEWYKISDVVSQKCDIITREDYLLCSGNYKYDEYIKYKNTGLVDTTVFVARRTK
jgi:SAM-dependent methyltransferase